ncbi:hypothetical protein A2154_03490 [Candidatus Gottesmanbacteria bacterium RBG_16_43_7]|uniref:Uncharacterized protein n=1 Tax=Candidatus Gottesmanbacteria bacterium RBG_16_43_7 TaxID=1798373 RepID=A0A1F5Z7A2_9BACT|nr:MAG: hypothetical protein A2154_03490 [Candidatus Gottesmanbacteria bacterium RBG_16_43_7]
MQQDTVTKKETLPTTGQAEAGDPRVLKDFKNESESEKTMKNVSVILYIILIFLGVGTGFLLSSKFPAGVKVAESSEIIMSDKVVGSTDVTTFKDSAAGTIEKGGLNGEGTHKLVRAGGPSQTVYLISSVVDLDQFVGQKVTVWGQTMAAQKAAWLMDVGKVEL